MSKVLALAMVIVMLGGAGCRRSLEGASNAAASSNSPQTGPARSRAPSGKRFLAADYFPLAPGSQWEFEITYSLPLIGTHQVSGTTSVAGLCTMNGRTYARVSTSVSGTPINVNNSVLYRVAEEGIYQLSEAAGRREESLHLPTILETGSVWTMSRGGIAGEATVVSQEKVRCLDVTYDDCIHICATSADGGQMDRWLARGVGAVRSDIRRGDVTISMVLKSFKRD